MLQVDDKRYQALGSENNQMVWRGNLTLKER
jgi:hypothetical protein